MTLWVCVYWGLQIYAFHATFSMSAGSVNAVTKIWAGWPENHTLILGEGGGGCRLFHSQSVQTKSRTQLVYNTLETLAIFLVVMHPKHNANYLPLCKIWGFQQCRWRFESCGMLHSVIGVLIPGVLKVYLQGQEDEDEDIWKYQIL